MIRLLAVSDLHLERPENKAALWTIGRYESDWLILAGDITTHPDQLDEALTWLTPRFARIVWTPGNHEFWGDGSGRSGPELYLDYLAVCHKHGCLTPEDPFERWPNPDGDHVLFPIFAFYDYSFAPDHVPEANRVPWAIQQGVHCLDEARIDPSPYKSFPDWCARRLNHTRNRLDADLGTDSAKRSILISHFPLRKAWIRLHQFSAFAIWCGTRETEHWPQRYRAEICIHGHLHNRSRRLHDGVRVEEVSLGYPGQWNPRFAIDAYLREILTHHSVATTGSA